MKKELLRDALRLADVDFCEVRFEESDLLSIMFQGKGLDTISQEVLYGGNVRALYKGAWGQASFNDINELPAMVINACQQARMTGEQQQGTSKLAPAPVVEDDVTPHFTLDPRAVTVDEKVRILTTYSQLMQNFDPAIIAVSIVYNEKISNIYYANTEGSCIKQLKLDIGSNISATARRGATTLSKGIGLGSSRGFDCMLNAEKELEEACCLAVQLLDAPQVKAGVYPVVCDPPLAGLFIHEAFGHLSEADNVYKNPEQAKTMTMGRKLGKDILTVFDTGEFPAGRGSFKYDDEGVPTERTYLIKEGVLVGRLHTRETAGIMGEKATGNARALNYTFPPICRMRSTCIAPGESSFEDMIKDIELGVYALGSGGGQTNGEMFVFNATHGYMIRNGKIAELVRDVKLMGNVFSTLENIDKVGNEAVARNSAGGCGKGAQAPLATSGVNPTIRIQNVIIGGAK